MRVQRLRFTAAFFTLAILISLIGAIIQRQFAQGKKIADNQPRAALIGKIIGLAPLAGSTSEIPQARSLDERDRSQPRSFISAELEFERKQVKGAPFSAELVIETLQPLQDGSRTVRRSASMIYRDGQGRTRRDRFAEQNGALAAVGDQPQVSIINDLVAGFTYVLDPRAALANRSTLRSLSDQDLEEPSSVSAAASPTRKRAPAYLILPLRDGVAGEVLQGGRAPSPSSETKKESLGQSDIEGMMAEGTRLTKTIPAGALGNRQPIEIVAERWYSPELQTVLLIKRSDPRFGESVYRLTNIKRGDPAATLFAVPNGYKIRDEAAKDASQRD
jgi:hypothetical protein